MVTETAKTLIPKAKIIKFSDWQNRYSQETLNRFQTAESEGRYLNDQDLSDLFKAFSTELEPQKTAALERLEIVRLFRDQAEQIVTEARESLLRQYPHLTEPGGDLYPPARAKACWRDFWQFLRCITYGIAAGKIRFTDAEGLYYMNLLYQELQVPLEAMVSGLEALKQMSLKRLSPEQQSLISPYFDHLISKLKDFHPS